MLIERKLVCMELPNMKPFDAYVEETRRRFWREPEGVRHSAADHPTIGWIAFEIVDALSDEQVLHLLSDLYLRRRELRISIPREELDAPIIEETVQSVLIAAVIGALRKDDEIAHEDAIREAAAKMSDRLKHPE